MNVCIHTHTQTHTHTYVYEYYFAIKRKIMPFATMCMDVV